MTWCPTRKHPCWTWASAVSSTKPCERYSRNHWSWPTLPPRQKCFSLPPVSAVLRELGAPRGTISTNFSTNTTTPSTSAVTSFLDIDLTAEAAAASTPQQPPSFIPELPPSSQDQLNFTALQQTTCIRRRIAGTRVKHRRLLTIIHRPPHHQRNQLNTAENLITSKL